MVIDVAITQTAFTTSLSTFASSASQSIHLSRLLRSREDMGVALYISPLKALINDQWGRLEQLCEELGVPVTPWHGDISPLRKRQFMKRPQGVLLMTPESLEAMFVLRGHELRRFFGELEYMVVDELHVFIGSDRGKQLQSLMHRIEMVIERRVPRVGLSATLGDMDSAGMFLRPTGPAALIIQSKTAGQELKLQLRGYTIKAVTSSEAALQSRRRSLRSQITFSRYCTAPTICCSQTAAATSSTTLTCCAGAAKRRAFPTSFGRTMAACRARFARTPKLSLRRAGGPRRLFARRPWNSALTWGQ